MMAFIKAMKWLSGRFDVGNMTVEGVNTSKPQIQSMNNENGRKKNISNKNLLPTPPY